MASIKGIELKNVKEFLGHEEETLVQGNVYYKGKKVGYYSQDAWGGPDIFRLDYDLDSKTRKEIEDITNNYVGGILFEKLDKLTFGDNDFYMNYAKNKQIGYEYLFMELLQLLEHEKLYKKYSKKWHLQDINIVYDSLFKMHINNKLRDEDKLKVYYKYNSLNDCIIKEV